MEEQRSATRDGFSEMNHSIENQRVSSSEWNNKIASQLLSTHEKVEKFVTEELRRDVPTGNYL